MVVNTAQDNRLGKLAKGQTMAMNNNKKKKIPLLDKPGLLWKGLGTWEQLGSHK